MDKIIAARLRPTFEKLSWLFLAQGKGVERSFHIRDICGNGAIFVKFMCGRGSD